MKRKVSKWMFGVGVGVALLAMVSFAFATASSWGTPTFGNEDKDPTKAPFKSWSIAWTASSVDGTVITYSLTASDLAYMKGWYLYLIETVPGTVAPTVNYDIAVYKYGTTFDIIGTALANLDNATTERRYPKQNSVKGYPPIDGKFTISVSGNSINSATGTIKLWLAR
jgi:hypothetical protein